MEPLEQYVKPFVNATLNTFKNFVGIEASVGHPHFSDRGVVEFERDISAVIGLTGEIRGAVVVSMKKEVAIKITDNLVGASHSDLDDDVVDALGEIANIIAGNMKQEVPAGEKILISRPTVVKGKGHTFAWPGKQSRILCISFKLGGEAFYLLVDMERVEG